MSVEINRPGNGSGEGHIVLSFDDNGLASQLFGQFDAHLAMLEQQLGVEAAARGNRVDIKGGEEGLIRAKQVLDALYERLLSGETVEAGDVEGAIRMSATLPSEKEEKPANQNGKPATSQITTRKKLIQARSKTQNDYIQAMEKSELVFGIGPAGTGKTYLAVAYAAAMLERGAVDRIILSRPAVEAGERLGFLPGDMKDKVDPYLRPLYDALYDMMPGDRVERAIASGEIEIAPLAFMRGRTLSNAAVILDEAQNTTSMQMKMFLTRLGENSRMIITGDPSQIDLPRGTVSGLVESLQILKDIKSIVQIKFTAADVVRHRLVADIVKAYDAAGAKKPNSNG